jgi:hypothetical protein
MANGHRAYGRQPAGFQIHQRGATDKREVEQLIKGMARGSGGKTSLIAHRRRRWASYIWSILLRLPAPYDMATRPRTFLPS